MTQLINARILASLGMIVFVAAVVASSTGAFFSDTETSTGNTFTAGDIDLKIDNHSWYNGLECAFDDGADQRYEWTDPGQNAGNDPYLQSLIGTPCSGTWELADLDGHLFFDFEDLKPGDWEEDTISLHVGSNSGYMCANLKVTKDDDVTCTDPELGDDATCGGEPDADNWDGDLGTALQFIFWKDDGDNVLEDNESIALSGTPSTLDGYGTDGNAGETFPIADSSFSIFGTPGTPVPGGTEFFIGKAFCFGTLTPTPVAAGAGDPAVNPGFTCNGSLVNNAAQTDEMMGDMSFSVVQSRNNEDFLCNSTPGPV